MRLSTKKPEKKTKLQIYIPKSYYEYIKEESEVHGVTISELVRTIIRKHYGEKIKSAK